MSLVRAQDLRISGLCHWFVRQTYVQESWSMYCVPDLKVQAYVIGLCARPKCKGLGQFRSVRKT